MTNCHIKQSEVSHSLAKTSFHILAILHYVQNDKVIKIKYESIYFFSVRILSEAMTRRSGYIVTLAELLAELSIVRKKYLADYFIFIEMKYVKRKFLILNLYFLLRENNGIESKIFRL